LHTPDSEYALPPGVEVRRLGKRGRGDAPRLAWALRRFARERDVIVAFQAYAGVLCLLGAVTRPWALVMGDVPAFHWRDPRVRGGMPEWLIRRAFRRAAVVSVPGRELAGGYRDLGVRARRWATIPNMVGDQAFVEGAADRAGALFVGRLVPEKGPLLAVEAAAVASVPLTVHGVGPLEPDLVRLAGELGADVALRGFTDRPGAAYARHRVLVVSSQVESFGNVIVESLAAGTPVVAGDCDFGPREILAGARFSHVVPRSAQALGAALRSVAERPRDDAEAAECLDIARRYTPEAVLPELEALLAAAVAG
jgi:glycosyltransferase involved in cell wall biosynthesis